MNTRSKAKRQFLAECAAMAVVAVLWLASLVLGLGGPRAAQAISNFGLIAAALISLPFAAQSLAGRLRQVLDGLMIAASLLLASWVMVLRPLFRSGSDDLLGQAISLAYPIGDVVVGTIVLFVLARARMGRGTKGTPVSLLGAASWPSPWPTAASCTSRPAAPTPRGR